MVQYKSRAQVSRRAKRSLAPSIRALILDRDAYTCGYCGYDAEAVDHIVPYSYGGGDEEDNLIACCRICNNIAANHVFDTLEEKRSYVRSRYGPYLQGRIKRIQRQLSLCGDCRSVFQPYVDGASSLLCGECYEISETGRRKMIEKGIF